MLGEDLGCDPKNGAGLSFGFPPRSPVHGAIAETGFEVRNTAGFPGSVTILAVCLHTDLVTLQISNNHRLEKGASTIDKSRQSPTSTARHHTSHISSPRVNRCKRISKITSLFPFLGCWRSGIYLSKCPASWHLQNPPPTDRQKRIDRRTGGIGS
jgi:hypothetical protein